ncbi:MAG TPA: NAD(P)-dependent oxidoreductase [Patescibacteria group bacterium]|jgi:D-lactate dehydrogenase|nr:NAD(P)-dependent oxidoreductase [Patescibacteria group bacterium]
MAKVVIFEVEDWEEKYIETALSAFQPVITAEKLEEATVGKYQDVEIISTFIYSTLTKELLDKLPNLKFIATRSMGFDHIDMVYCKQKGIVVSNVPTYGAHTVAEHTFALMLAVSRKLIPSVERAKKGDFSSVGLTGFDLFGKTLGVIGTGHIGKNVCELGLSFGMQALAYCHSQDQELLAKGVKYVSLEELLAGSDIVTLHLPHSHDTEHIINLQNINQFKKGAILINTARGALVETQAVLEGLEQGILAGAGLDVLEEENALKEEREFLASEHIAKGDIQTQLLDHILLNRDDVVITPHNAFNSIEALHQILETSLGNIRSFLSGTSVNIVE